LNPLAVIGQFILGFFEETGRLSIFTRDAVRHIVLPPIYFRLIFAQMVKIGYNSLPVVGLTAFFTGGVLALQIYIGGSRFNAESLVSSIVALGITRELGPVMAGLMVAGRVRTLSTNPFKYLVVPRLLAATITMPFLVLIADILGIMGGYVVGTKSLGFNGAVYIRNSVDFIEFNDVASGLIKAAVFGFIIALMGCYHGYQSKGGAQGVGRATTNAVVSASILILAANYALTSLLFS